MHASRRAILVTATLLALTAACGRGDKPTPSPSTPVGEAPGPAGGRSLLAPEPAPGVHFRLRDAKPVAAAVANEPRQVSGEALTGPELGRYLARLPALPPGEALTTTFALRPGPPPPALTGDTRREPWPPPDSAAAPPEVSTGPLTVLRTSPEGEVPMAAQLTVTFSEPMVPLSSHGALAAAELPLRLDPAPAGEWRWVGTKTLLFEPDPRFPQATEYQVEIPAGTRSARGATLADAESWSFRTPAATLLGFQPGSPTTERARMPVTDRQPLLLANFDQRVDPAAVLGVVRAEAAGAPVALRLATAAELEADPAAQQFRAALLEGRWAAFRPSEPLPLDTVVNLTIGPGLPSAEGPRQSDQTWRYNFRVYGPLRLAGLNCEDRRGDDVDESYPATDQAARRISGCRPGGQWKIRFSNPLDPAAFDPDSFSLSPDLPGTSFEPDGDHVQARPRSEGRTDYVVRVPAELKDIYGQTLGQALELGFGTGEAQPALFLPGQDMLVLDPAAGGKLDMASVNVEALDVRLFRVGPEDWPRYLTFLETWWRYAYGRERPAEPPVPPGNLAWQGQVKPAGGPDKLALTPIDLAPALDGGFGQVIALVEPAGWQANDEDPLRPELRWVQVTGLGLKQAADAELRQVWATNLADGAPLSGIDLSLVPGAARATTNAQGLAELPREVGEANATDRQPYLVARRGADTALLPLGYDYGFAANQQGLLWYTFDDRGLYRPGETVHVKGWLRPVDWGKGGDLGAADPAITAVDYVLTAPNGEELAQGSLPLSPAGGFDGAFELPADVALGEAYLSLTARGGGRDGGSGYNIRIAEFRRPEYEVSADAEAPEAFLGDTAYVQAQADYYAGGALAGSQVTWRVRGEATSFNPPDQDDFIFGRWTPWWDVWGTYPSPYGGQEAQVHVGQTDGQGQHRLAIDLANVVPLSPATVHAEATVADLNRQAWSAAASFLVHPARYYVGLRPDRWFAQPGQDFGLELVVADLDGKRIAGWPVTVSAERMDWVWRKGAYVEEAVPAGDCQVASAAEPVRCTFSFDRGGQYRLKAEIRDPEGRANESELKLWVSGGEVRPGGGQASSQRLELIPDAQEYQPGDTAQVLVRAPFSPAEGLMTLRRAGLVRTERFRVQDGSHTLRLPISEAELPAVTVQVDLVGRAPRRDADGQVAPELPPAPAFASGSLNLSVPPRVRALTVSVSPRDTVLIPGGRTTLDVAVTGADGRPVPDAEVALVVVDMALLALSNHEIPDPLASFHPERGPGVVDGQLRDYLWLADPATLAAGTVNLASAAGGGAERGGGGGDGSMMAEAMLAPAAKLEALSLGDLSDRAAMPEADQAVAAQGLVTERSDLNPLAHFTPALVTDAAGRVSTALTLPDNVTRYRITALASDGARRFGKGESDLTARLPLAVRPAAPRFLNFGDAFELPVLVQNQTDEALTADVVLRAANLSLRGDDDLLATGPYQALGRRIRVPANDRVELRFPAAALWPGTAAFQVAAFSEDLADAQRVQLPTWTPATTEAFATYGELDAGAMVQPLERPPGVEPSFGGLDLTLSSTALGNLSDAFLYLRDYPFESSEVIASRLVATLALKDVLAAFALPELPDATNIEAALRRDLDKLAAHQNWDGGFGWWGSRMDPCGSDPFLSTHISHALARAALRGYAPRADTLEQAKGFLRNIDQHLGACRYAGEGRHTTKAYALFTLALLGEPDPATARWLLAQNGEREVEALGWLLQVLSGDGASAEGVAEIHRQLANRASEEAATAQFTTGYVEGQDEVVLASDRRADAVALEALIVDQPANPLIPKLARGLLDQRVKGRWSGTQENGWVLLALERYFRTYEGATPDFLARAWLGEDFLGETELRGRSADRSLTQVPMEALPAETTDLVLAKEGEGRLYYRLGLRYVPEDLDLEAAERGFSVSRSYAAVDDAEDVKRLADGSYEIRAGARVRVRLKMVADSRRYHVAMVDPLPAGLEALNPDLALTGELPPDHLDIETGEADPYGLWWWPWYWYEHQAFRDERTEAFASFLAPGVYDFSYVARATTPGSFVAPPARAEEQYHPETFGRSGTDRVRVR